MHADQHLAGTFELAVLSVVREHPDSIALDISKVLEAGLQRPITRQALDTTIGRLIAKGFLETTLLPTRPTRGRSPRHSFRLTVSGAAVLTRMTAMFGHLGFGQRVARSLDDCKWFVAHKKKT